MNKMAVPEQSIEKVHRPRWRRRVLLGSLIVLAVCLVCLAAAFIYFVLSSNRALREALAEADQLDPGWRIPELEEKRALVPDSENSGLVLMAAKNVLNVPSVPGRAALPPNWPFWEYPEASEKGARSDEEVRNLEEAFTKAKLEPCMQLDAPQTEALRQELGRADKVLTAVRKVADLPRGRYPITYSKDVIRTLLPYTGEVSAYGRLLGYDAMLRVQEGDVDGALTSCRAVLNCGRSIGDEPTPVSMLIRMAVTDVALRRVERALAQGEPSEGALARIQGEFEAEEKVPLLLIAARGDRACMDGSLQAVQSGDLDPWFLYAIGAQTYPKSLVNLFATSIRNGQVPRTSTGAEGFVELMRVPGMAQHIRAALLKYDNRFVEIAKLPVEQQAERLNALKGTERDLPKLARPIVAAWSNRTHTFLRGRADLRCAVVMLAVERYRRANNRWPDALTDLVPEFFSKVPCDPFDGAPVRYRRVDDGVAVYSIGHKQGSVDMSFRLWDVPRRRQPPRQDGDGHER